MAITDKTRKVLWARSGNRCAICKRLLVADRADIDPEAVIGDECHIEAAAQGGPRRGDFIGRDADHYDNLILLCKNDHQLVDKQPQEYPVARLLKLKKDHEAWVRASTEPRPDHSFRIRAGPEGDRATLTLISSGSQLLTAISGCMSLRCGNEELTSEDEVELVADFFQEVHDSDELLDLGPAAMVRAEYSFSILLGRLASSGFLVYAGRLNRQIAAVGQVKPWREAVVGVYRNTNPHVHQRNSDTDGGTT